MSCKTKDIEIKNQTYYSFESHGHLKINLIRIILN